MKQLDLKSMIPCPYDLYNEEEYIMEMNQKFLEIEGMFELYSLMEMGTYNIPEYIPEGP